VKFGVSIFLNVVTERNKEILLGLFFDSEDGRYIFLQNIGWLSTDYMALYPRRYNSQRNNPVPSSRKTHRVSITKTSLLIALSFKKEDVVMYCPVNAIAHRKGML
jgi:hypothetical protein